MKTYEEMTRSVIEKVQKRKAAQKRRNNIVLTAVGFCLILVSAVLVGRSTEGNAPDFSQEDPIGITMNDTTQNTGGIQMEKPRFTLLCASSGDGSPEIMTEWVKVPCRAEIRVRDVSGMTEEERQKVLDEENSYVSEFKGENIEESGYGRNCRDNVIVTFLHEGALSLVFDDIETVARLQVTNTNNGYIFYPRFPGRKYKQWDENGHTVEFDGDSLRSGLEMLETETFDMIWHLSSDVAEQLNENPNMELHLFSDQITIQIDYLDGRKEVSIVRMEVDEDGKVYAVLDETVIDA